MTFSFANTAAAPARPMVAHGTVCAPAAKRNERIGQPDTTGTGGPAKE